MANEGNIVTVNVSLSGSGITRQGFGILNIYSNTGNAWGTPELYRLYSTPVLTSVAVDFATTTPEYQAAAAAMAQPIKPPLIMISKGPSKPTQIKNLSISVVTVGATYKVNVYDKGVLQSVSYLAAGSVAWAQSTPYVVGSVVTNDTGKLYVAIVAGTSAAPAATGPAGTGLNIADNTVTWNYVGAGSTGVTSNDAIVFTLKTLINALAAPTLDCTATVSGGAGSRILVTTGNAAGNWHALEPIASGDPAAVSNLMAIVDVTTDPGVATDLTAILGATSIWYALVLLFKSAAIVATPSTGAAAWCEANGRLLLVSFSDTASATSTYSGGTDALHTLAAAGYSYTAGMWHPRDYEWFDAAKLGFFITRDPGSANWTYKTYAGVTPVTINATQFANLRARRVAFYYVLGGLNVDGGLGQVCSTTYGFIDNRVNIDWYTVNLQADLVNLEIVRLKLANTNAGRRLAARTIASRNDIGIVFGVISPDPLDSASGINDPYTVYVPPVSVTSSYDAATRALSGMTSAWKLAGAYLSMTINVAVTQ